MDKCNIIINSLIYTEESPVSPPCPHTLKILLKPFIITQQQQSSAGHYKYVNLLVGFQKFFLNKPSGKWGNHSTLLRYFMLVNL